MNQLMMLMGAGPSFPGLLPPADSSGSENGTSVALSEDDVSALVPRTMVIGAPGYLNGAISIYRWNGAAFGFFTTIFSPSLQTADFGAAVAISDDGTKILVGAPNGVSGQTAGAVYAYIWDGVTYSLQSTLLPGPPPGDDSLFGSRLSISKDGLSFIASAPDSGGGLGSIYSFFYSGIWQPLGATIESPARGNAHFGASIDLASDGLSMVASSPTPSSGLPRAVWFSRALHTDVWTQDDAENFSAGLNSVSFDNPALITFVAGSTQLWSLVPGGGSSWVIQDQTPPAVPGGNFGIAQSANGSEVAIGETTIGTGTVSIYAFDVSGNLTFLRTDVSPAGQAGAAFGAAISLVNLAPHMAIGEPLLDRPSSDQGNAYALVI